MPVAALTPDTAANLVAAALTAANLGSLTFTRARWPKYALKDLAETRAHVVAVWPARMDPHDDAGTATETPLAVTLDAQCEKTDDAKAAALTDLLEQIGALLSATNIEGLGYPIEPLLIDRSEELLDKGHFCGGVGAIYRRYRDAEAGP